MTSAATLTSRRRTATRVVRVNRYGRAERMSSTGAAGRGSVGTAGFVLTGASLLLGWVLLPRGHYLRGNGGKGISLSSVGLEELSGRYADHNRTERGRGFVF